MKNITKALVLILMFLVAVSFVSCGYVDEPQTDDDNTPAVCEHADLNGDHKCDTCGELMTGCASLDNNHNCDLCGAKLSDCADDDNDHYCDLCSAKVSECELSNETTDHKCKICGEVIGKCSDTILKDHKCDACGAVISTCEDNDNDHACDVCSKVLSECEDTDNDHNCNTCGETLSVCKDDDKNHACDICGATSQCADNNNDHKCDICGEAVSTCTDDNNDHKCDTCGETTSTCADDSKDHKCDVCSAELSTCADGNNDHKCDVCSAKLSSCVDADENGICDVCNGVYRGPSDPVVTDFENAALPSGSFVKHFDSAKSEITDFASQDPTTASVFSIADDPTGAANKVLKITKLRDDNGANNVYTRVTASNEVQTGSCVTLEFKMYSPLNIQYDTNYIDFYFNNDNGEEANRLSFYLYQKNAAGTNWLLRENNSAGTGGSTVVNADGTYEGYTEGAPLKAPNPDGKQTELKTDLPSAEWVSFKIEFYQGGTLDSYAKVWVNGVLVADGVYHNGSVNYKDFAYVQLRHHSKTRNEGVTYFDDISVTLTDKEYVYTDTTAPVVSDFEDGELESDYITNVIGLGDNGDKAVADLAEGEMAGYVGNYVTLSVTQDPTDATNKVLAANKVRQPATGSSSNGTASYTSKTRVAISNENPMGEYYTFETDFYITNVQYDVTIFNLVGSDGKTAVSLRIYNDTANSFYIQTYNASGASGCTGSAQIKDGDGNTLKYKTNTWYTLKFEWYRGGAAENTMAKVYICERGGEEVCIFNGNMWNYYGIDQRTVSYMEIQHRSARAGVTYFDNISLTRTDEVYEA